METMLHVNEESASGSCPTPTENARKYVWRTVVDRKKSVKDRKVRRMRRMRKLLVPKNAIVALHELQGLGNLEFITTCVTTLTKVEVVINNVKYEAIGTSKHQAKLKVCESALRDLTISQMNRLHQQQEARVKALATNKAKQPVAPSDPAMSEPATSEPAMSEPATSEPATSEPATSEPVMSEPVTSESAMSEPVTSEPAEDEDSGSEMDLDEGGETDDLPMEQLAGYALFKLFEGWEKEGFEIPALQPPQRPKSHPFAAAPGVPSKPKGTKTVADLPADAATRNPAALFSFMRPQVLFNDLGSVESALSSEYTVSITSDGQEFIGRGRSKKHARKAAAATACKTLFGVEFDSSVL